MNVGSRQLKEFEDVIEAGELVVLADVPPERDSRLALVP